MNTDPFSPIPSQEDIARGLSSPAPVLGIDYNERQQKIWLGRAVRLFPKLKLPVVHVPGRRYWYLNGSYGALDAIFLATIMNELRPQRIDEVGSGYSSALISDLNEDMGIGAFFTSIDPDLTRLEKLTSFPELMSRPIYKTPIQDFPLEHFDFLSAGDILFIDSTHVAKIGSDVTHILFNILPRLKPGVLVHFHDVFDGFEYPREWFAAGRYWNEQYMLRAFLMNNSGWQIECMTAWLFNNFNDVFRKELPVTLKTGGGSLWIRKL